MVSKSPLFTVQYLRAIAALMVAYAHMTEQIPLFTHDLKTYLLASANLTSGVDIFFVISGFIMLISNQNSAPSEFVYRRLIRVVPLYWVLTTVYAIMAVTRPELFRTTVVTLTYWLKSLAFIPYANPGHEDSLAPLLLPGWSLNVEMFFYAIFAIALFAPRAHRLLITGAFFILLVSSACLVPYADAEKFQTLLFLGNARVLEFWFGMVLAHFFLKGKLHFPIVIPLVSFIGGFVALLFVKPLPMPQSAFLNTFIPNVLPATAILFGAVSLEQSVKIRKSPTLMYLGDISYSIYLSHIFSLGVARVIWQRLGLEQDKLIFAVGFVVFSALLIVIGAALTYKFLEKPLLHAFQHRALRAVEAAK